MCITKNACLNNIRIDYNKQMNRNTIKVTKKRNYNRKQKIDIKQGHKK